MRTFFSRISHLARMVYMPAALILIFYPVLLAFFAYLYSKSFSIGAFEILSMICTYYVINISVGVGLHRYWSHNAFSLNRYVQFVLMILASSALQGPILMWASNHAKHHMYTDTPLDPHSPRKFNGGIKGFLWAHIGWMLIKSSAEMDKGTLKRLGRDRMLMFQFKYYWLLGALTNTVLPAAIGFAVKGSLQGAIGAFIFMGLGRAAQQHATFCVNSMTHYFGKRIYERGGTAGDIFWMAPFLLGENWHSFHHAFPSDYRNGAELYQFDVHKWIIWTLEKLGLAHDVKRTSELRIIAQRKMVLSDEFEGVTTRWDRIKSSVANLQSSACSRLATCIDQYESSLSRLSAEISGILRSDNISKNLIERASNLLSTFERNMRKLEKISS